MAHSHLLGGKAQWARLRIGSMTKRDFEIKLGLLVMESLATGLDADDIVEALKDKLAEELRLQKSRRVAAMSY